MEPIVGELVIEQVPERRRGFFSSRPAKVRTWSRHRNVWEMTEENFPVKYLVHSEHLAPVEVRVFGDTHFVSSEEDDWVLEDVVKAWGNFDELVEAAQRVDLHHLHTLNGQVWIPVNVPNYLLVASQTQVVLSVCWELGAEGTRFEPEFEQEALAHAHKIALGREVVQLDRIEEVVPAAKPTVPVVRLPDSGPVHPVAELALVKLPELAVELDRVQAIAETPAAAGSDVVAQLSVLSSAVRRLLDDARTLNNDPLAR